MLLIKRSFLIFTSGIVLGFWISWPGILIPSNWKCFLDVIQKSTDGKIPLKAAFSVSPKYILKAKRNNIATKIRILNDTCFR